MAKLGFLFALSSFILSLLILFLAIYSLIKKERESLTKTAYTGSIFLFILITLTCSILLIALVKHNFKIEYVANYTDRNLPLFYTLTAFWAGQQGSLLLWLWFLSTFTLIFLLFNRKDKLTPYVFTLLTGITSFFLLLITIPANPFKELPFTPPNGQGLNPLLQNLGMAFHPPTIFLGFACFTIPFALALAALMTNQLDENWIRLSRKWSLYAWFFLGIGNVLGAIWAYVELGWGGYWAWDPVENASLLPWLTGTALIHSLTIYKKRKTLKIWTFILAILTFILCIFGTYLTRSGILSSVHAFEVSPIGNYFLVFMVFILASSFGLLWKNAKLIISPKPISSCFSKEGSFLINNWLFAAFTLVVFWGTTLPIITQFSKTEKELTVGKEFFNTFTSPIAFLFIFLIGVCPYLSWENFELFSLQKKINKPFLFSFFLFLPFIYFFENKFFGLVAFYLSLFTISLTLYLIIQDIKRRSLISKESRGESFFHLFTRDKHRYGGLISHLGVVLIFMGIIGSTLYKVELQSQLYPQQTQLISDITLRYERPITKKGPNYESIGALLTLYEKGIEKGVLIPALSFYETPKTTTAEVAIKWGPFRDIYIALSEIKEDDSIVIVTTLNPLATWLWIGSLLLFLGTTLSLWPEKKRRK